MKKPEIIRPLDIRVFGNVMPHTTNNKGFESFYSKVDYKNKTKVKSLEKNTFTLSPLGKDVFMTASITNPSGITENNCRVELGDTVAMMITLTTKDDDGNNIPVVNHQIYIAVDTVITDQQLTNKNGIITYNYTCEKSGEHEIKFYTKFEDGYNGTEKSIKVTGLYDTILTLESKETRTSHTQPVDITAKLKTTEGTPIKNAQLHLYENNYEMVKCFNNYKTDTSGIIKFPYKELHNYNQDVLFKDAKYPEKIIQNKVHQVTGKLVKKGTDEPVANQLVSLYLDYQIPPMGEARTDDEGYFSIDFKIEDNDPHMMFIANNRDSSLDTTASRIPFGVDLYKRSFTAVPVPTVEVVPTVTSIIPGQTLDLSVTVTDKDASFKDEKVYWWYSLDQNTWYPFSDDEDESISILGGMGGAEKNFIYNKKAENLYIKAEYKGNAVYGEAISNIVTIHYNPEKISLNMSFTENNFIRNIPNNIKVEMKDSSNKPIVGYDIEFWEIPVTLDNDYDMTGIEARRIGVAKTNNEGVAIKEYTPINRGNFRIKAIYKLSINVQKYDATEISDTILVQKRTRKVITTIEPTYNENTKFQIPLVLQDELDQTPLSETVTYSYQKTGTTQKTEKTITTNNEGKATLEIPALSEGTYVLNIQLPSTAEYYRIDTRRTLKVTKKEIPELNFYDITCKKGEITTINVKAPSDYRGKIELKTVQTNKIIAAITPTDNDKGILEINTIIDEDIGRYNYKLVYASDSKYSGGTTTDFQELKIYGSFSISCANAGNGIIEAKRKTNLLLTGRITDLYNEDYTGTVACWINGEKFADLNVSEGYFGKDSEGNMIEGISINIDDSRIENGKNDLKLICSDQETGVVTEKPYNLNVTRQDDFVFYVVQKESVWDANAEFKCYYPSDATGKIEFYETDANGEHLESTPIAILNATNGTNQTNGLKTILEHQKYFLNKNKSGGTYYYTAKLVDDPKYATYETVPARYYYHVKAVITPTSTDIRAKEDENLTMTLTVKDSLNQPYTGILSYDITYNGSTTQGTIDVTNGVGTYTVPTEKRKVIIGNSNNVTKIVWKYESTSSGINDDQKSRINTTLETRIYNISGELAGYFINTSSGFNDAQFKEMVQDSNHTDLFVFYSALTTESNTNYQNVYNKKETKQFRIHPVISVFPNSEDINDTTGYSTERLNLVKSAITKVLTDYPDSAGICLDYMRYKTGQVIDTNHINTITGVMRQLVNHIKQLEKTNQRTYIITATVSPEVYTNESWKCNYYNQSYKEFSISCDYVLPMLYVYDYISNYNADKFYAMQDKFKKIISLAGKTTAKNNFVGILQTYNEKTSPITKLPVKEVIYNTMATYMLAENGYLYFRAGLTSGLYTTPSQVRNYKSNTGAGANNKVERNVVIKLESTTISKSTTEGIKFSILDTYGGYVTGGTATIFIDGTSQELTNPVSSSQKTSLAVVDQKPLTFKVKNLTTFSTGKHTIKIGYNGNATKGIKSGTLNETEVTFTI